MIFSVIFSPKFLACASLKNYKKIYPRSRKYNTQCWVTDTPVGQAYFYLLERAENTVLWICEKNTFENRVELLFLSEASGNNYGFFEKILTPVKWNYKTHSYLFSTMFFFFLLQNTIINNIKFISLIFMICGSVKITLLRVGKSYWIFLRHPGTIMDFLKEYWPLYTMRTHLPKTLDQQIFSKFH